MICKFQLIWFGLVLFAAWQVQGAGPNGTDVGWTVDHNSGQILFTSTLANQLAQGESGWVRVEVALVKGHTNWDATMLGYYDTVVNTAHNAGLQVLMLIDSGSWPGNQASWCMNNAENNPGQNGDNLYMENYTTNAVVPIVQHFHDRVKVYELWNEPNCWNSNPSNGVYTGATYIYPSNFGWLLARSWEAIHVLNQFNDVILVSGGLFGLNSYGANYSAAGGQYLDDTYSTGTNLSKGGSFAHTKSNYQAYPLDGVGEHIYITQGGTVSSNTFRQYEDWVHQAVTKYEGTNTPKKTFITEFGWQTTNSGNANGVSMAVQDTNLVTSFSAIQATPYVQTAIWFQWADSPAGGLWYGVVDSSNNHKPSYADYQRFHRFEGIYPDGTTNTGIQTYFAGIGQSGLGNPFDNGHGAWVYAFLNGYAQDYGGGSHENLTIMNSTNGTFELNSLHGLWGYYQTNYGAAAYGYALDNEYANGSGTRQDFAEGYLTWDPTNQVVWHATNNLPLPWVDADVGNVNVAGNADYAAGVFSANGSGADIGATVDAFNFVYEPLTGDGAIVARVKSQQVTDPSAKAGVMMRESLASNAVYAMTFLTPSNGIQMQYRAVMGVGSTEVAGPAAMAPYWLKLTRSGTNFTSSISTNGINYVQVGTVGLVMSSNAVAGLAVSSHTTNTLSAVNFDNVGVMPVLGITQNGVINWSGAYSLQSATNVAGPYTNVPGATNPYVIPTGASKQQFYRLRN